ncbi:MAG TPA: hypothetical protein VHS29_08245 [Candidatus Acidoferrales bacterium]|jgi:hypothetical protein|nr:hypothetical protein [Candidatus Acidoferrales bacterium]
MTPEQILIVSDDPEFVRSLVSLWRKEKECPAITVVSTAVSTGVSGQANSSGYQLIVVGPLRDCASLPIAPAVQRDSLVCAVGDLESLEVVRAMHSDWLLLPECPGWTRILFSLASEVLRRTAAETRTREAEIMSISQKRFGVLGKSLLEARPGMVNALTSLLGNADLMLLSEEPLPVHFREHVRTIHTMALRLNEIVQRLSSIENEMELSERKSHLETPETCLAESSKR